MEKEFMEQDLVVGDEALLDASSKRGLLIDSAGFFMQASGGNVYESPRVQVYMTEKDDTEIELHYHEKADEIVYIYSGSGEIYKDGQWHTVKAGDLIINPRGRAHTLRPQKEGTMEVIGFYTPTKGQMQDTIELFDLNDVRKSAGDDEIKVYHLGDFYESHPLRPGEAASGESIYKTERVEVVLGQNHGPLIHRHYHSACEEIVYVYGGSGEMFVDGRWIKVKAGDFHINPRGVYHGARCVDGKDMQVLCLFTPPQPNGNDKVFLD